jgi:hypothetical protein
VEDVVGVQVGDAEGELMEEEFELGGEEGFGKGEEEGLQVVFEEVEDEEYTVEQMCC